MKVDVDALPGRFRFELKRGKVDLNDPATTLALIDPTAAARGDALFAADGKAGCGKCHVEPLWTEPGWNLHTPGEMKIDSFQADRAPDNTYKTMNLAGIFVRELGIFMKPENKGRFYHDGRFATLLDVVNSYNDRFNLGLTTQEKSDIVEYLKSL